MRTQEPNETCPPSLRVRKGGKNLKDCRREEPRGEQTARGGAFQLVRKVNEKVTALWRASSNPARTPAHNTKTEGKNPIQKCSADGLNASSLARQSRKDEEDARRRSVGRLRVVLDAYLVREERIPEIRLEDNCEKERRPRRERENGSRGRIRPAVSFAKKTRTGETRREKYCSHHDGVEKGCGFRLPREEGGRCCSTGPKDSPGEALQKERRGEPLSNRKENKEGKREKITCGKRKIRRAARTRASTKKSRF